MAMLVPTVAPMTEQIVPGPRAPGVIFTGQLLPDGSVANTTTQPELAYASVTRIGDVKASPYVSSVPCKCGVRNPDNTCVTGQKETMPFEATTQAQKAYLSSLWDTKPFMPVSQTDRYMMMREAPVRMGVQQPWGPLLGR
jgi:hypothetical protein